jgi:hypothetical protein
MTDGLLPARFTWCGQPCVVRWIPEHREYLITCGEKSVVLTELELASIQYAWLGSGGHGERAYAKLRDGFWVETVSKTAEPSAGMPRRAIDLSGAMV